MSSLPPPFQPPYLDIQVIQQQQQLMQKQAMTMMMNKKRDIRGDIIVDLDSCNDDHNNVTSNNKKESTTVIVDLTKTSDDHDEYWRKFYVGNTKKKSEIVDLDSGSDSDDDSVMIINTHTPRKPPKGFGFGGGGVGVGGVFDLNSSPPDKLNGVSPSKKKFFEEIDEAELELFLEAKKAKLAKTPQKTLAALVDKYVPECIRTNYHVLETEGDVYDAMLNQTKIEVNTNKFYLMQVLESNDGNSYLVYYRWGRVGSKGQDKLLGPFTSQLDATREFELKFCGKTNNFWPKRKNFIPYPDRHIWLEMDYSKMGQTDIGEASPPAPTPCGYTPRKASLDPRVASFITLICNVNMMTQQMKDIGYNAEKLPLENLSKTMILKGYEVLKRIADEITGLCDMKVLEQLSGEFYTVIPHDFGYRNMRGFVIDTTQKLRKKLEMVEALGEIEHATKLLADDVGLVEDPLYSQYKRLRCELIPVENSSGEFSMIKRYLENTHGATHYNYSVDIAQIFRVSREGEYERFKMYAHTPNRMLLWHGSRLTNWTGILSQGLRIAPPEAPASGKMFGNGIYFADMFSKSANYCFGTPGVAGVIVLCEVALGPMQELLRANPNAHMLPLGMLSTKGVGLTMPDPCDFEVLRDGVLVPYGKPVQNRISVQQGATLHYNEYIVYNPDQIRIRYVVQLNFKQRVRT